MESQTALQLWKSQMPIYQQTIKQCLKLLVTPLIRFLPNDFEIKTKQLRDILQTQKQLENYEQYLDIIVHHIEGVKDRSIIQLAQILVENIGGKCQYWENVILDIANNVNYGGQLTIWHTRKVFDQKLYINAENLSNYRILSKISKSYLLACRNLIKYIQKFDKKINTLAKIDDLFKKFKYQQSKYIQFIKTTHISSIATNNNDNKSNNISRKSRQKAIKKLFNFAEDIKTKDNAQTKHTKNTLFSYNFKSKQKNQKQRISQGLLKTPKIINQAIKGLQLSQFQQCLKNVASIQNKKQQDHNQLRKHFIQTNNNSQPQRQSYKYYYTSIFDKDYYFTYNNYYIQYNNNDNNNNKQFPQIDYLSPFRQYTFINYQIDDQLYYNQIIGEDINQELLEQVAISSCSQLSNVSFIQKEQQSQNQNNQNQENQQRSKSKNSKNKKNLLKWQMKLGQKWTYCHPNSKNTNKQQLSHFNVEDYKIIILGELPLPVILSSQQNNNNDNKSQQTKLKQLLIKNNETSPIITRKSIQQILKNSKQIKMSKNKIDKFIKKYKKQTHNDKYDDNNKLDETQQKQNSVSNKLQDNKQTQNQRYQQKKQELYGSSQDIIQNYDSKNIKNKKQKLLSQKLKYYSDNQITEGPQQQVTLRRSQRIKSKQIQIVKHQL